MKQFRIAITLIAASILLCACPSKDNGHQYITLANKSDQEIVCQALWSGSITNADTLYQCHIGAEGIRADTLYCYSSLSDYGWESDFEAIPYLQLLIMDAETYSKYLGEPCDTIRKYVPILHRYRLKLEDLQRMNWTVVYPPEE